MSNYLKHKRKKYSADKPPGEILRRVNLDVEKLQKEEKAKIDLIFIQWLGENVEVEIAYKNENKEE